jgi:hypothetical protein
MLGSLQANDWRFSISIGTGSIDYEEDVFQKDDNVRNGSQSNYSDTYTPSVYGIGLGNGTHTFGYKITSASASDYDYASTSTLADYTTVTLRERDYEETTISYQYRLNAAWTLGVAYNDKEHEYNNASIDNIDVGAPWEPFTQAGETAGYRWDDVRNSTSTQDGLAVYATWQKLFANHWVFAAKLGVSQTDLDQSWQEVQTISGVPVTLDALFAQGTDVTGVNGSTLTYAGNDSGDATTVYGGLSLIRIFPSAPNHQIIFSVDGRTDDLAGESVLTINGASGGTGYFTGDGEIDADAPDLGSDIEEYNLKYTLEYKYTF